MWSMHCRKCGKNKTIDQFYKGSRGGLRLECKRCTNKARRTYHLRHREDEIVKGKEWRKRNLESDRKAKRKYAHSVAGIYSKIKAKARSRNVPFKIKKGEFIEWYFSQEQLCVFCGFSHEELLARQERHALQVGRLTIDRKDNRRGYEKGNLALACYRCNSLKGDFLSYGDMLKVGAIIRARHIQDWRSR